MSENEETNVSEDDEDKEDKEVKAKKDDEDDDDWDQYKMESKKENSLDTKKKESHIVHCPYFPGVSIKGNRWSFFFLLSHSFIFSEMLLK